MCIYIYRESYIRTRPFFSFLGPKKFSLKNNYDDSSFVREKVAADVFKDAGLAVSHTAFYTLYVDHGNGPEYFGLYTLVEEVDGSVLDDQFISDDGNLYKPEDGSANFVEGTFDEEDFTKKTNEIDARSIANEKKATIDSRYKEWLISNKRNKDLEDLTLPAVDVDKNDNKNIDPKTGKVYTAALTAEQKQAKIDAANAINAINK